MPPLPRRRIRVTVGGYVISEPRITIRTEHSPDPTQDRGTVEIFNLARERESAIYERAPLAPVLVEAGYGGALGVIWDGIVQRVQRDRRIAETGVARITRIDLGDNAHAPGSLGGVTGRTYAGPTRVSDIAADLAGDAGMEIAGTDLIPADATVTDFSHTGQATDGLGKLLSTVGLTGYDDGGAFRIAPGLASIRADAPSILLSPQTGLIGAPTETDEGAEVTMWLNSAVERFGHIQLQSETLQGSWVVTTFRHNADNWSPESPFHTWADLRAPAGVGATDPGAGAGRVIAATGELRRDPNDPNTNPWNGRLESGRTNRFVVVHTAESGGGGRPGAAQNVADYFLSIGQSSVEPPRYAGYHFIIDEATTLTFLDPATHRAYHAIHGNDGVGISFACNSSDWATMATSRRDAMLSRANTVIRQYLTAPYRRSPGGTPPGRGALDGLIVAHGDIQLDRSDPGRDFPWATLLGMP